MKCLIFVTVLMMVSSAITGADLEENDESLEENVREIREYNQQDWRPAEAYREENLEWIPREDLSEVKLKRRRLRKRKRRPSIPEDTDSIDPYPERQPTRRRLRPQRLDELREPWREMDDDAYRKPNVRRRVTPPYHSPEDNEDGTPHPRQSNREKEPTLMEASILVVNEEATEQPQARPKSIADLKKLLKKSSGNISLSELLQQKNLSLSELLNGGEQAISALTESPQRSTQPSRTIEDDEHITKYRRLPPTFGLKRTTDRNYEQEGDSSESLSARETVAAQRRRLALLQPKENKLFSTVTRFDVDTEPTTERRIFVPAHSKYYTSLNFKPDFGDDKGPPEDSPQPSTTTSTTTSTATTTTTSTTTRSPEPLNEVVTYPKASSTFKPKGKLPTTNAKLKQTTKVLAEDDEEPNYPFAFKFPRPLKISIKEVVGFKEVREDAPDKKDEPLRVPIDIETMFDEKQVEKVVTATTEVPGDNSTYVTAREEIMEIMKDPTSRDKLSRILESRNMTLNELVEQRERGSSQLHLADIFHNDTKEPEPKEEPFIGSINPEYFDGFQTHVRQQKSRVFDDEEVATNNIKLPVKSAESVTMKMEIVTVRPTEYFTAVTVETAQNYRGGMSTFPWKQLYPDLFADPQESKQLDSRENLVEEGHQLVEDVETRYSTVDEHFSADEGDDVFLNIPSGIRSALFVSLAIIGLSLVVFLAILVVLKCFQRKTRAINYCSSLSSRVRSPIILQSRQIKTFMNETLGRNKNYFRSSMQSMSDEIWNSNKDIKPSF